MGTILNNILTPNLVFCPPPSPASGHLPYFIFHWSYVFTHVCICNLMYQPTLTSVYLIFLSRNTNKMQLCNRIYYSKVYWRLNIFRAAHRSSSGAPNCTCSLWFMYCNKVIDFVYIIHSPYYNITIVFPI